jgi:hypothetical protein
MIGLQFGVACKTSDTGPTAPFDSGCVLSKEFAENSGIETVLVGEKVAQSFVVPTLSSSPPMILTDVVLFLSTVGLTQVTLSIYDSASDQAPDSGILIDQAVVTRDIGTSSTPVAVTFPFNNRAPLNPAKSYQLVLTVLGGSFDFATNASAKFPGVFQMYSSGMWTASTNANERASVAFKYWLGCP